MRGGGGGAMKRRKIRVKTETRNLNCLTARFRTRIIAGGSNYTINYLQKWPKSSLRCHKNEDAIEKSTCPS